MKKSIYFVFGIVLSGIVAVGFWTLKQHDSKPALSAKKETKKVSLLTINYIPTTPVKPVEDGKFWELSTPGQAAPHEKDLKDLKGKPVILHFWATWCGPCVKELPDLDIFAKKYENTAHVIAVATDLKDVAKIQDFYKAKGIKNLSITFDKGGVLSRTFRTSVLPTTIFINSKGEEIGRIQGMVKWTGRAGRVLNTHLSKN